MPYVLPVMNNNLFSAFSKGIAVFALGGIVSSSLQIGENIGLGTPQKNKKGVFQNAFSLRWFVLSSLYLATSVITTMTVAGTYLKEAEPTTILKICTGISALTLFAQASNLYRQPANFKLPPRAVTYGSAAIGLTIAIGSYLTSSVGVVV